VRDSNPPKCQSPTLPARLPVRNTIYTMQYMKKV
jgi:hypothetical protein